MSWGIVSFIGVVAVSALMYSAHRSNGNPGAQPHGNNAVTIGVCRGR
jgi:hypothetical protein